MDVLLVINCVTFGHQEFMTELDPKRGLKIQHIAHFARVREEDYVLIVQRSKPGFQKLQRSGMKIIQENLTIIHLVHHW
jgi:hypothetical protein